MSRPALSLSALSRWVVGLCVAGLSLFVLAACVKQGTSRPLHLACTLVVAALAIAAVCVLQRLPALQRDAFPRWVLPALCATCLVVKAAWALTHPIEPAADYATFHGVAKALSQSWTTLSHYVEVFPHIFGYASFLSLFYAVFGATPGVAVAVNLALTVASLLCLWYLASRLVSPAAALCACLMWIALPSQTAYNVFVLSEPYYTTLLLAAGCAALHLGRGIRCRPRWGSLLLAALMGVLLALVNAARPIAAIGLIAMGLYLFFLLPLRERREGWFRLALFACAVAAYLLVGLANNALFTARLGAEPASGVGYSVAVGFNWTSNGTWNQADGDLFAQDLNDLTEGILPDADGVQERWAQRAKERLEGHGLGDFLRLFVKKLQILLSSDDGALIYAGDTIAHPGILRVLSNGAWIALWGLTLWAMVRLLMGRLTLPLTIPALFVLGLALAHLLVEVALRYHYSMTPALILLAAAAGAPWKSPSPNRIKHT